MLRRREQLDAVPVYFALRGAYTFFFVLAISVNLVFQTEEANLNPLQLVLVGALLEATIFVFEVPTGIVADVYSRRLSVVIGLFLVGAGLIVNAAMPRFETILAGQIVWGIGHTFISGAHQAWIADEVGVERVGGVYLRSAQFEQLGRLLATPVSIGIAVIALNLPILLAGAAFMVMAPIMLAIMPERGFQRPEKREAGIEWGRLFGTLGEGSRVVRRSPLLITILASAAFYGMASEGFDRLWVAQFYRELGFPHLWGIKEVLWIGVVRMGWVVLSFAAVALVIKRVNTTSHAGVSRGLFIINLAQAVSLFLFASSTGFTMGMIACWSAVALSSTYEPLYLAWLNQHVESRVRATVISMRGQVDAIGQIAGGPALGLIGTVWTLRAALFGAGVVLLPALALYTRAMRLGAKSGPTDADPHGVG